MPFPETTRTSPAVSAKRPVIRPFDARDEAAVVALWNRCLERDSISLTTFRRNIVLDANFDDEGCLVACDGKAVIGFMMSICRRYPYYDLGLEEGKGWITSFFVHPDWTRRSVGSALLERAETFLASKGIREVSVSDYTPHYVIPGVDLDAYPAAVAFLRSAGYRKARSVYGMGGSLVDFAIPAEMEERFTALGRSGFRVEVFRAEHTLRLLAFLRQNYPGDLFRVAHDRLREDPACDEIMLALKEDEVVGFSHFQDERFGPFGIADAYGGRGLGPFLYYRTVELMRRKGKRNLWLAWTTGRAKDFYTKVGLKVQRRHVIMHKELTNGKGNTR